MKYLLLIFLFLATFTIQALAQNIDVQHYDIQLDLSNLKEKYIYGKTQIYFSWIEAKQSRVKLELVGLKVSKVKYNNRNVPFTQNENGLEIDVKKNKKLDNGRLLIEYEGKPLAPSYFGGFYINDSIAYNLGVIIDKNPHNFGKSWFPCVDNFTDKAKYTYKITTTPEATAVCGGVLVSEKTIKNKKVWTWKIEQPIPTYLASVAVGNYELVKDTFHGIEKVIPIELYVYRGQGQKAKSSFIHIKKCLSLFEKYFGAYQWPKVGYVAVPMVGGAMEHAMNIAYPESFIDGSNDHDKLWVHELSHSWFGNLATCATQEDMWLNEGFARYCEYLFAEKMSNANEANGYLQDIVKKAIVQAPKYEGGFLSLSNMPDKHTYGTTVYDKGATVIHTLRGQLGDSLFFGGLRSYFKQHAFGSVSTENLFQSLQKFSNIDLSSFRKVWVDSPGFIRFGVDTFYFKQNNNLFDVETVVSQSKFHKNTFSGNFLIDVLYIGNNNEQLVYRYILSDSVSTLHCGLSFEPKYVVLDPFNKICDAALSFSNSLTQKDSLISFDDSDISVASNLNFDLRFLKCRFNYTTESRFNNLSLATNGFWSIEGNVSNLDFSFSVNSKYRTCYWAEGFDENLLSKNLGLFYRFGNQSSWQLIQTIRKPTNRQESFTVKKNIDKAGQYAIFWY